MFTLTVSSRYGFPDKAKEQIKVEGSTKTTKHALESHHLMGAIKSYSQLSSLFINKLITIILQFSTALAHKSLQSEVHCDIKSILKLQCELFHNYFPLNLIFVLHGNVFISCRNGSIFVTRKDSTFFLFMIIRLHYVLTE